MDFNFLADADRVALQLERAKRGLESAKAALESAKHDYDELLLRSEELGIPRAKLRKLTDDRIQSLTDSGMLELGAAPAAGVSKGAMKAPAKPRKPKADKNAAADADFSDVDLSEMKTASSEAHAEM